MAWVDHGPVRSNGTCPLSQYTSVQCTYHIKRLDSAPLRRPYVLASLLNCGLLGLDLAKCIWGVTKLEFLAIISKGVFWINNETTASQHENAELFV